MQNNSDEFLEQACKEPGMVGSLAVQLSTLRQRSINLICAIQRAPVSAIDGLKNETPVHDAFKALMQEVGNGIQEKIVNDMVSEMVNKTIMYGRIDDLQARINALINDLDRTIQATDHSIDHAGDSVGAKKKFIEWICQEFRKPCKDLENALAKIMRMAKQ